mmetsp:Transcript_116954/g.338028  ORF Transcript_116954/g.338028 Transcript_116954/m.338028 type:complete len:392 (+) Transcript_116954:1538-2713(+)
MPTAVGEEEFQKRLHVSEEVFRREVVGVEDVGSIEPRCRRQAGRDPHPWIRPCCRSAHDTSEHTTAQQHGSIVVSDRGVVQVQALVGSLTVLFLPVNEWASLCGKTPACGHILGPTVAEFVHDVVPDRLGLEDEHQGRQGQDRCCELQGSALEVHLHPQLGEERGSVRDEEEEHQPRETRREHARHDRGSRLLPRLAMLDRIEGALAVRQHHQKPCEHQQGHADGHEELREVVPGMGVVERHGLRQVEHLTQAECLAAQQLLTRTGRQLREEPKDGVETHVAPLGKVEILAMADVAPSAAEREIHAGEDVLRQIQCLRRFRDAALLHHVTLLHQIRVSVVHARSKYGIASLEDRAKSDLGSRSEISDAADVACDVLGKPNDLLHASDTIPA